MKAFVSWLLYLAGHYHANQLNLEELRKFRKTMSSKLFHIIYYIPYHALHKVCQQGNEYVDNCNNTCLGRNVKILPSKPAKNVIKIFALVDLKSLYTHNMEI